MAVMPSGKDFFSAADGGLPLLVGIDTSTGEDEGGSVVELVSAVGGAVTGPNSQKHNYSMPSATNISLTRKTTLQLIRKNSHTKELMVRSESIKGSQVFTIAVLKNTADLPINAGKIYLCRLSM